MPIERRNWITREMVRAERDKTFVFSDNLLCQGMGGQAGEMRGEPNAVGLPTMVGPETGQFLTDSDIARVAISIDTKVEKLAAKLEAGGTVVWPKYGIGSGFSELEKRAPLIAEFYGKVLQELERRSAAHK